MASLCLTEHARQRQQQRGISKIQIEVISLFGEDHYQKGGTCLSYVPEKMICLIRYALDELSSGENEIVMAGHGKPLNPRRSSMSNTLTAHAHYRRQQREIFRIKIDLLHNFGGNSGYIERKTLGQLRHAVDKLSKVAIVKGEQGRAITVEHMYRRIHCTQNVA